MLRSDTISILSPSPLHILRRSRPGIEEPPRNLKSMSKRPIQWRGKEIHLPGNCRGGFRSGRVHLRHGFDCTASYDHACSEEPTPLWGRQCPATTGQPRSQRTTRDSWGLQLRPGGDFLGSRAASCPATRLRLAADLVWVAEPRRAIPGWVSTLLHYRGTMRRILISPRSSLDRLSESSHSYRYTDGWGVTVLQPHQDTVQDARGNLC
jgi:hypothetical protein